MMWKDQSRSSLIRCSRVQQEVMSIVTQAEGMERLCVAHENDPKSVKKPPGEQKFLIHLCERN